MDASMVQILQLTHIIVKTLIKLAIVVQAEVQPLIVFKIQQLQYIAAIKLLQ